MLSKCLSPNCLATFHHLGQGRLFRIDFAEAGRRNEHVGCKSVTSIRSKANPIEYFWLCEGCASISTVELTDSGQVRLVPREGAPRRPEPVPAVAKDAKHGFTA
jgi:hypothetical protein